MLMDPYVKIFGGKRGVLCIKARKSRRLAIVPAAFNKRRAVCIINVRGSLEIFPYHIIYPNIYESCGDFVSFIPTKLSF